MILLKLIGGCLLGLLFVVVLPLLGWLAAFYWLFRWLATPITSMYTTLARK